MTHLLQGVNKTLLAFLELLPRRLRRMLQRQLFPESEERRRRLDRGFGAPRSQEKDVGLRQKPLVSEGFAQSSLELQALVMFERDWLLVIEG